MILPQRLISLLVKCMPVLAFLVSTGVNQDTVSVGPTREPYPVFKAFNLISLKDIHSFIHSFMHSTCGVACPLCTGLWSGARDSYQQDRATVCFHGAVILVGEMYSKKINGSINRVMKGS